MKYAIHCYEKQYNGDNGIYTDFVMEAKHYQEAIEEARFEALDLVQSYGVLLEQFWNEAVERFKGNDDDIYAYYNQLIKDDIAYKIVPIREEAPMVIQEVFSDFIKKWRL